MDLMALRRGLLGVMASARGLRYATGSLTIAEQTNTSPTIMHNLGTKKVFALWWAESGTEYASYNRIGWQSLINWWDIIPDDYHLTVNKGQATEADISYNKNNPTTQVEQYAVRDSINNQGYSRSNSDYEFTDNTIKLRGPYINVWAPGTYHWIVVALEDALNKESEG